MKNGYFFFLLIIALFSCRTSLLEHSNKISIREADRILQDALQKAEMISSNNYPILFRIDMDLDIGKIIYFDSTKIKKLDLSYFPYFKKNKKVKLVDKSEINQGDIEKEYIAISFNRLKENSFYISIGSSYYIPKGMPLEMDGIEWFFAYKIVHGKAELIRYRGG